MIIDFGIRHFHHIPSSYKFSYALQNKLKTLTGKKKKKKNPTPTPKFFFGSVTLNKHIFFLALQVERALCCRTLETSFWGIGNFREGCRD